MKSGRSVFQQLQRAVASPPARCARCNVSRLVSRAPHARRTYATVSVSAADLQFGQPVYETHPHLLHAGESALPSNNRLVAAMLIRTLVTPGITAQEYADRRAKLAASLPPGGIAILASADTKYRSGVVTYEFHQEPNFLYLTGFNEPQSVAVIQRNGESLDYTFHLFVRPKNAHQELWDGAVSGEQAALDVFNADEVCRPVRIWNHMLILP
jgi:intermediate cleaving peptidase 55